MLIMSSRISGRSIGTPIVLAIGTAFVAYGAYLLVLGPEMVVVLPNGPSTISRDPSAAGLIPLAAGLMVLSGILRGSGRMTWLGAMLALAFAVLFVFSMGGILLPFVALQLVAVILRFPPRSRSRSTPTTA